MAKNMQNGSKKKTRNVSFKISSDAKKKILPEAMIRIKVRAEGGPWRSVNACLDSGAHRSLFNLQTMKMLGLIEKGLSRGKMLDWRGRPVPLVFHPVEVKIKETITCLNAAFSKEFRKEFNILGMDFFSLFRISFDIPHGIITLKGPF